MPEWEKLDQVRDGADAKLGKGPRAGRPHAANELNLGTETDTGAQRIRSGARAGIGFPRRESQADPSYGITSRWPTRILFGSLMSVRFAA